MSVYIFWLVISNYLSQAQLELAVEKTSTTQYKEFALNLSFYVGYQYYNVVVPKDLADPFWHYKNKAWLNKRHKYHSQPSLCTGSAAQGVVMSRKL